MNWQTSAESVCWNVKPFINGCYKQSASTECFEKVNPATERALYRVAVGNTADIDDAVRVARKRFNDGSWSQLPAPRRAEILSKLADLVVQHSVDLALLDSLEMGKPIQAALQDTRVSAPSLLRSWAGFADKLVGESAPLDPKVFLLNVYEPRGVVGAIVPWNFPLVCAVVKCGPALAAGNTVVLKPSELSPSSALKFAELALEAGVPEGVLNVVPGIGSAVGTALALHSDVDMLSFTGSTATARKVMESSARSNGKALLLECGGKSPEIVFNDVDSLDAVADSVVQSVLWNQGQVCGAKTRLIAHEEIKGELLDKVISRASRACPGDPLQEATTYGPLASPIQRDRVRSYIEQGLKAGASAVLKGRIQETDGCYVWPTIFDGVDRTMSIVREEIFGPVLCVQSFNTDEEAIALANDTDYGLAATAWTRDMGRGKRLVHAIRAGAVAIRTSGDESPGSGYTLSYEPQKFSGFGAETGLRGLQSYSTLKMVAFAGA